MLRADLDMATSTVNVTNDMELQHVSNGMEHPLLQRSALTDGVEASK